MPRKYQITPLLWQVHDESSVKFHVKSNDYFGTIATVLSLLKQQIKTGDITNAAQVEIILANLENDLMLLQKNYHIKPNVKKRNKIPKGKLINQ
jgi:hypothetical protein